MSDSVGFQAARSAGRQGGYAAQAALRLQVGSIGANILSGGLRQSYVPAKYLRLNSNHNVHKTPKAVEDASFKKVLNEGPAF